MKKVLSVLLLVLTMLLSACGGEKYEFKDGLMYEDGKAATGTFEFSSDGFKTKGKFVDGLAEGIFEQYYSDGKLMLKIAFEKGENIKQEVFYRNGNLLLSFGKNQDKKVYLDNGNLIFVYAASDDSGEDKVADENGNVLMTFNLDTKIKNTYNEKNELLLSYKDGEIFEVGDLDSTENNGIYEFTKDGKLVIKYDSNKEIEEYFYSTGELMRTTNNNSNETKYFYKNGKNLVTMEDGLEKVTVFSTNGKALFEIEEEDSENGKEAMTEFTVYNEDGKEIFFNFAEVKDIKKID